MKIKWRENYKKECWEIRTPKSIPMARIIEEDDIPDLMKYNSEPNERYIWTTREQEGTINAFETMVYWWYGYRSLEEMIRKKYNLGFRYFEIINPPKTINPLF